MALEIGQVIEGKYRIIRLLGEGGMGAVYEGENVRIRRKVAIKILHAMFAENKEVVQRFEREAQAAGHIGNDHIMEVLDLGQLESGDLFLVMEYLDGEALSGRLKRLGQLTPEQLVPLFLDVLAGLGAAHHAGIIHRDLKPDNIFILKEKAGKPDFVKIIDFGISKFQPLSGDGMRMTKTGAMMGTPYYMSPEQATGSAEIGPASDIYALGVILFECVTGAVPFDAPTFNQLLFKIALTPAPDIREIRPDLDPGFASIVSKAMAREISARFSTCAELADALRAWAKDRSGVVVPPQPSAEELRADTVARASQVSIHGVTGGSFASSVVPQIPGVPSQGIPAAANTAGNWATTQANLRKPNTTVLAGIGLAAVLVLGAVGLLLARLVGSSETAEGPVAAEGASAAPGVASPESPVQAESAPPPGAPVAAAEAQPAEKKVEETKEARAEEPKVEPAKPAATASEPVAPRAPARVVSSPTPAPVRKPATTAAPAPAPAPKKTAPAAVDYGY
jgi:eukaryotic-like serine/threonine-protein kinase